MNILESKISVMICDIEKLGKGEISDQEFKTKHRCTDAQLKEAKNIYDEFGPNIKHK